MKKRVILLFSIGIIFVLAVVFSSYHKTANGGEVNVDSNVISAATEGNSIYAITVDGVKSTSFPAKGLYRASVDCEGATGKWDYENWKLYVDDITGNISCDISFTSISKTYLTNKIIGLANTTQGNGKVIHESANLSYDNSTFTAGSKLSQSNYTNLSNDATYAWTWNSSYSAWTSSNKTDSTTSTLQFKVNSSGYYQICYKQSSEMNYDYGHLYKDGVEIYNLKGISNTSYQCRFIGYLSTSNVMKFTYSKDSSASSGSDEVSFYFQGGTYNENISTTNTDTGYRYEGKNPNNYIWFNNELWRIIGVFGSGSHGQSGNLTKIVRETPIGGLAFDKSNNNNWATSGLKRLLNGAYFNRQDGTGSGYCYGSTSATTKCNYSINGLTSKWRGMVRSVNLEFQTISMMIIIILCRLKITINMKDCLKFIVEIHPLI